MKDKIAELTALMEKATPGKLGVKYWEGRDEDNRTIYEFEFFTLENEHGGFTSHDMSDEDAALIVAMWNTLSEMLERLGRLEWGYANVRCERDIALARAKKVEADCSELERLYEEMALRAAEAEELAAQMKAERDVLACEFVNLASGAASHFSPPCCAEAIDHVLEWVARKAAKREGGNNAHE